MTLGVTRGTALYVGALIGPGLLLVPSLAAHAAGPASIVAWGLLLVFSVPLMVTFAALGVRHPVTGGVSAYVQEGFGATAAAITGNAFMTAVAFGGPAVSLIGGFYVADLTGSGTTVAVAVAVGIITLVYGANWLGLRVSSSFQLAFAAVLVGVVALAIGVALPSRATHNWAPFAPHGWWAVGTAASILVWMFVGWEAMAQLAGDFRDPARDLPRAMTLAFVIVTVLYVGLAAATIAVTAGSGSRVPLADLISVGFGRAGRDATAVLAVALTMGTMNVYTGSMAKLAAALARDRALPGWLGGDAHRSIPRRPLAVMYVEHLLLLAVLAAGGASASTFVRATSACFVLVYVLALASAARITTGGVRVCAGVALVLIVAVGAFSGWYLLVPAATALLTAALRYTAARHVQGLRNLREEAGVRPSPVALDGGDEAPL
ncbi:MAG TPA: amino acid permease [Gaiellaceae bacterium]|nr:amino acid permease [Gaiellaceae bacterium]